MSDLNDLKEVFDAKLQRSLIERDRLSHSSVQRLYSRKEMEQGFLECFELVGGVPRLAIWANNEANYGEFLKLLMKFAPKEASDAAGATINFLSSIPESPLNNPQPDHMAIEHDGDTSMAEDI